MKRICGDCITAMLAGEQAETIPANYTCEMCAEPVCAKHVTVEEYRPYCDTCLNYWNAVFLKYAPVGVLAE